MDALKLVLLALFALWSFGARAVVLWPTADEYVHATTGHYRLVPGTEGNSTSPGPGWIATGYHFYVGVSGQLAPRAQAVDVCHFRAAASDSYFYTAVPGECDFLRANATGWQFQGIAFEIESGRAGCGTRHPVYRLYNNRWMFNDSNHRFTPDPALRTKLIAAGWADEGIAFCTWGWGHLPTVGGIVSVMVNVDVAPGLPCDEAGSCISVNHLPPMPHIVDAFLESPYRAPNPAYPRQSHALTGMPMPEEAYALRLATGQPLADVGAIVSHSFVQSAGLSHGIHVNAADRRGGDYASINPQFRFATREFPFANWHDPSLVVDFWLRVATLTRADPGSHAYGGPVLLFIDRVSGKSFYIAIVAYGSITLGDGPEAPGRDVHTGRVLVSTTFRAPSFGNRLAGAFIACPGPGACEATATRFSYSLDRASFQVALDRARSLEPGLSIYQADYYLESFHFLNETYRDADVGLSLGFFSVQFYAD